jgi:hypothetical protein
MQVLAEAGFRLSGETVVWLNDLERYLGGNGIDRLLLDRVLSGPAHVLVLATLRKSLYGAYLHGEPGGNATAEMSRSVREILEAAGAVIQLGPFGVAELRRAEKSADPRVRAAAGRPWSRYGKPPGQAARSPPPSLPQRSTCGARVGPERPSGTC